MRHRLSKFWLLLVAILGISLSVGAVTDEINRIAEQADKLYVQGRYSEAFPLMKRAAEGGDVISMFTLGTMYYEGHGTAKSESEARHWWQEAANRGDSLAKEMLNRLDAKQANIEKELADGAVQDVAAMHEALEKKKQIEEHNAKANVAIKTYTANGVSFTMVEVEGGTFTMGATPEQGSDADSDEKPAHQVTLSSFSIGQTEVTQELWQAVMGSNPSYFTEDQRPVDQVNWKACQKFIKKLNKLTGQQFRLPTEAEWEYAARGGKHSMGYKYSGSNTIDDVAWYKDNSGNATHAVGTKFPNELGLYDMSGNVYEWCQDWYGSYTSVQTNPTGPTSGDSRVDRGGSWLDDASDCRVSLRAGITPSNGYNFLGLRLAL